jgi:uncharacterized protein (DUF1810 family)
LAEAQTYLQHRILGARLIECVQTLNNLHGLTATRIFGPVGARKLQSCVTLFAIAADEPGILVQALQRHYVDDVDTARPAAR